MVSKYLRVITVALSGALLMVVPLSLLGHSLEKCPAFLQQKQILSPELPVKKLQANKYRIQPYYHT